MQCIGGIEKGIEKGIQATIRTCKNFNINKDAVIKNLMKEFSLSEEDAVSYIKNTGKGYNENINYREIHNYAIL